MILSEGVPVSDRARGYLGTAALWNEAQAAGWKKVTDAVHAAGGQIFAQLWHCGRISHSALHADGSPPAGASKRVATDSKTFVIVDGQPAMVACEPPVGLSTAEVKDVVQQFAHSAWLAQAGRLRRRRDPRRQRLPDGPVPLPRCSTTATTSTAARWRTATACCWRSSTSSPLVYEPRRIAVRQSPYGNFNDMVPDPDPLVTYPYLGRRARPPRASASSTSTTRAYRGSTTRRTR